MTTFIPEEHIGRLIVRARSLLSQNLYHELNAAGINITSEQWGILTILLEEEGITQTQLAERAYKDKPTTTRMLTLMEKRGYIRRQRDESDRRAHLVFLNDKGRLVAQETLPLVIRIMQKAQLGLTSREVEEFKRILRIVSHNLAD